MIIFWFLSYFGQFLGFRVILVILKVSGVFWSFFEFWWYFGNFWFQGYYGHFIGFQGYFGHFFGFGVVLVIFGFEGILVFFFWGFKGILVIFWVSKVF